MRCIHGLSLLAVLGLVSIASAQQARPDAPVRRAPVETNARQNVVDHQLAAIVHNCNHNAVELAKFAQKKLKSDDAKEFAATMIKEHQAACDKFKKLAGQSVLATAEDASRREARRTERAQRVAAQQPIDWVVLQKEIGEQCLTSTMEELDRHEGANFDKAYIGQQIGAHLMMIDELKVFAEYATGETKQELELAMKTVEDHLKQARKIMEEQKNSK